MILFYSLTRSLTKRNKGTIQASDVDSRKTKGGRTGNEIFKFQISIQNLPVQLLEKA
jgi:hypothetical protein